MKNEAEERADKLEEILREALQVNHHAFDCGLRTNRHLPINHPARKSLRCSCWMGRAEALLNK